MADTGAFWSQPLDELFQTLHTSVQGLTADEAERRLKSLEANVIRDHVRQSALTLFLKQFNNPLIYILIFALTISAVVGEWVDVVVVVLVVVGSACLSFLQEYSASNTVEKLMQRLETKVTVRRDGLHITILATSVVPGDIILLAAGGIIPGDGRIIDAKDCCVDQAVLTGETFPVEKSEGAVTENATLSERTNCLFMGTHVRSGTATLLIVHTGKSTHYGEVAQRLAIHAPETEFEKGIRQFGYLLIKLILVLVLFVFAANVLAQKARIESLLFAIALAVGLAPEMLPAIITITLSQGAKRMAASGVIVRRLDAIENFGNMDVLCTDKTGTLTEGKIRLERALDVDGHPSDAILRDAYLNASFQVGIANPFDDAIVQAWDSSISLPTCTKLDEIPYDFVRKRLSVILADEQGKAKILTKGALDNMLNVCTTMQTGDSVIGLTEECRNKLHDQFAGWSAQGYRVLGVATKNVAAQQRFTRHDERDLTFQGYLLFIDPPKAGIRETLRHLAHLGVQIKIITGDNREVAEFVARQVGLEISGILSGKQLSELREEALWQVAQRTNLFVEIEPNQKERIIRCLQRTGHVVGYLGDGINDAPALHVADVGVSVDQAVDVAKEAADLVLLEHSLDVLRIGIAEGRRTFANTLKYVLTTTSANFGNMLSMAGISLILPFLPLLAKQILLNNLLSDVPGLTIAGDEVDEEWAEKPRHWDMQFIRDFMILFGLVSSAFDFLTFAVLLVLFNSTPEQFRTGWFVESLLTELVIALVVRTRRPFFRSKPGKWLLLSTLVVGVLTFALPYLPGINRLFNFVPLPPAIMATLFLITVGYVLSTEVAKKLFYSRASRIHAPLT